MRRRNGYWTLEMCQEDARRFSSRTEWSKASPAADCAARNNLWLDECSLQIPTKSARRGFWTLERCTAEAMKYDTRTEWAKASPSSYRRACANGWMEKCGIHMPVRVRKLA